MQIIRLIWKCSYCKDVVISYSNISHEMNVCECCKSGVDLENGYQRGFGDIEEISRKENIKGAWYSL